jgi:hypothetical protein
MLFQPEQTRMLQFAFDTVTLVSRSLPSRPSVALARGLRSGRRYRPPHRRQRIVLAAVELIAADHSRSKSGRG